MRSNMKATASAQNARSYDAAPRPDKAAMPSRLFLVPLGDDATANVKPWPAPMRVAFLGACTLLGWAIPAYLWLCR